MLKRRATVFAFGICALNLSGCVEGAEKGSSSKTRKTHTVQQALSGACSSYTWTTDCAASASVGSVLKVTAFGATGNDSTVDTPALQKAICCAAIMKETGSGTGGTGRAVVDFESGTYYVNNSIEFMDGVTLLGSGTTLKATSGLSGSEIILTTQPYDSVDDSNPAIVKGFTLDATNAGGTAHLLNLDGAATKKGKLRAIADGLTLKGCSGNGIILGNNVSAKISNISAENIVGDVLRLEGGQTDLQVVNLIGRAGSSSGAAADLNFSPNSVGHDGNATTKQVMVQLNNVHIDGGIAVTLNDGSTFVANNIQAKNGPFRIEPRNSTFRLASSTIGVGWNPSFNVIKAPFDTVFRQVTFVAHEPDEGDHTFSLGLVDFAGNQHEKVEFVDCTFAVDGTIEAADTVRAIYAASPASLGNKVMVRGGRIETGFDNGVRFLGGNLFMQDTLVEGDAETIGLVLAYGFSESRFTKALIDGVRFASTLKCAEDVQLSHANNELEHQNIEIGESLNAQSSSCAYGASGSYRGRRVIVGTSTNPVADGKKCIVGDIYRMSVPPASGQTYEWLCKNTTNAPSAGDWVVLTTMP